MQIAAALAETMTFLLQLVFMVPLPMTLDLREAGPSCRTLPCGHQPAISVSTARREDTLRSRLHQTKRAAVRSPTRRRLTCPVDKNPSMSVERGAERVECGCVAEDEVVEERQHSSPAFVKCKSGAEAMKPTRLIWVGMDTKTPDSGGARCAVLRRQVRCSRQEAACTSIAPK